MNIANKNELETLPQAEPAPLLVLLLLAAACLIGTILGSVMAFGWSQAQGIDLQTALYSLNEYSERPLRDAIRIANLLNHVATFTFPALLVVFLLYKRKWIAALKLDSFPHIGLLFLGILFVISSFPFAQVTYWLNHQLPLPDWAKSMEESMETILKGLLVMDSPGELLLNLLIIAILPAIGEELVFRGVVQQQLQRLFRNPVAAIWTTAVIFSAIHLQFEGFIPRVILGAALGYLFYWTRSLWAPILAHFFMNGIQVVAQYVTDGKLTESDLEKIETKDWIGGMVSLAITLLLGYYLSKRRTREEPSEGEDKGL